MVAERVYYAEKNLDEIGEIGWCFLMVGIGIGIVWREGMDNSIWKMQKWGTLDIDIIAGRVGWWGS